MNLVLLQAAIAKVVMSIAVPNSDEPYCRDR